MDAFPSCHHDNSTCERAFHHLRSIARICKYLSVKTTEILVHAFVTSKLDFCNSLLYGVGKSLLQKLQSVQNAAARLVTCSRKYDHVTLLLKDLHWLPIAERIKFKILLLTFKCPHNLTPSQAYIQDLLVRHRHIRSLRSSSFQRLSRPNYNLMTYGARGFAVSASELWNHLPIDITSSHNLETFKSKLFAKVFGD